MNLYRKYVYAPYFRFVVIIVSMAPIYTPISFPLCLHLIRPETNKVLQLKCIFYWKAVFSIVHNHAFCIYSRLKWENAPCIYIYAINVSWWLYTRFTRLDWVADVLWMRHFSSVDVFSPITDKNQKKPLTFPIHNIWSKTWL